MKIRETELSGCLKAIDDLTANIEDLEDPNSAFMLVIKRDLEKKIEWESTKVSEINAERDLLRNKLNEKINTIQGKIDRANAVKEKNDPKEISEFEKELGNSVRNELVRKLSTLINLNEKIELY